MCNLDFRFLMKKIINIFVRKSVFLYICLCLVFLSPVYSEENNGNESQKETRVFLKNTLSELYSPEEEIRKFYINRNFKPFWLRNKSNTTALIANLNKAYEHGLPNSRYPIEELMSIDTQLDPSQLAKLELLATEAFLLFSRDISSGILVPNMIDENINVYPKRIEAKKIIENLNVNINIER